MRLPIVMIVSTLLVACNRDVPGPTASNSYLVTNVGVVPMEREELLGNRSVLIVDGKIAGIFHAGSAPASNGALVIDGTGHYLAPGLVDAHVHVGLRSDLERYLAHGVTSIREMWGLPRSLHWRDAIEAGAIAGPHLVVSSTFFWLNGPPATLHVEPTDAETARMLVRQMKADGYDLVKVVRLENIEILGALIDEAHREGLTVSGHYPDRSVPLEKMLDAGMSSFEHLDEFTSVAFAEGADEARMHAVGRTLSEKGIGLTTILTPTVAYLEIDRKGKEYYTPDARLEILKTLGPYYFQNASQTIDNVIAAKGQYVEQWIEGGALAKRAASIFLGEGVTLAFGTEGIGPFFATAGVGIHDEMTFMKEAGLTNFQILRMATVNGAAVIGHAGRTGLVAQGYDADVLLLDGNPLEDLDVLKHPAAVFVGGRYYPAGDLASLRSIY